MTDRVLSILVPLAVAVGGAAVARVLASPDLAALLGIDTGPRSWPPPAPGTMYGRTYPEHGGAGCSICHYAAVDDMRARRARARVAALSAELRWRDDNRVGYGAGR